MSQNQEIIESKLCAYIDGELDAEGRAEIEKHLEANPQHRRLLESLRATRDLLRWLPREPAPAEIAETLNGQLERSVLLNYEGEHLGPGIWPRVFATAAIILLTAGLGVAVYYALPKSQQPAELAFRSQAAAESGNGNADVVPAPLATTEESPAAPDRARGADSDRLESTRALAGANASKAGPSELSGKEVATATPPPAAPSEAGVDAAKAMANPARNERNDKNDKNVAQLDELARQVAANPGAFVASAENETSKLALNGINSNAAAQNTQTQSAQAQNAMGNNAVVLLVRSDAPEQTERQLTTYFHQQQIEYRQAPLNGSPNFHFASVAQNPTQRVEQQLRRSGFGGAGSAVANEQKKSAEPGAPSDQAQQTAQLNDRKAGSELSQATTQPSGLAGPTPLAKRQAFFGGAAQNSAPTSAPSDASQVAAGSAAGNLRSDNFYVCQMSRRQAAVLSNAIANTAYPTVQVNEVGQVANTVQAAPAAPAAASVGNRNSLQKENETLRDNVTGEKAKSAEPPTTGPALSNAAAPAPGWKDTAGAPAQARFQSALNFPATQPSVDASAGDESLNVVIMVQPSGAPTPPATQPAPAAQLQAPLQEKR